MQGWIFHPLPHTGRRHAARRRTAPPRTPDVTVTGATIGGATMGEPSGHPRSALPGQATSFVGRRTELADLAALLANGRRLVTLVGVGGIGKTRLAVASAAAWANTFEAATIFVDLAVLDDPELVETAILEAAGLFPGAGRSHLDMTIERFAAERALFVLDNCEHLPAEAARVVVELLGGCPRVQVLATSREHLGVPGEVIWSVPPLGLDTAAPADGVSEAARLFAERLPATSAHPMDPAEVERLVGELGGIPLAIELAAAHAPNHDPATGPARAFPTNEEPDEPPGRHATMRRSLDWSRSLLDPYQALLFARLSVFANGWTLEAAEYVCADERLPGPLILDALTALQNKSLVVVANVNGHSRFRMLEPVRQYAAQTPDAVAGDPALPARHRRFFTDLALRADREQWAFDEVGRSRLDEESPNLRAAFDHACRHDARDALRSAASLALYRRLRGRLREGADATGRALALPDAEGLPERALTLAMHSTLVFWMGRLEETSASATQAIEVATASGDGRAHAHALVRLATALMMMDPRTAQPMLEQAADLARTANDSVALADALSSLAMSYHWQDDYARLSEVAAMGDAVAAPIAFDTVLSWNLWGRGHRARLAGDMAGARRAADELAALTFGEDLLGLSALTELAVLVAVMSGDDPDTQRTMISSRTGRMAHEATRWGEGILHHGLGMVELAADRLDAAHECGRILYERERHGSGYLAWHAQEIMMLAALAQGDHHRARAHAEVVLSIADRLGNARAAAVATAGRARAALLTGDLQEAETGAQEALAPCVDNGWWVDATTALELIAMVATRRGQHDRAVRVFTGVRTFRDRHGLHRIPREEPLWTQETALALAGLDHADRATSESAGATMSLPQLADYVRRGRGSKKTPTDNPFGLTPMEHRVAELAARGLPNRDIARELFIAPGTVKSHMSHIFAKLAITNRTELATILRRAVED
ncbi:helix-turn-helix transcriptional regulator [Embleya hyalina]|uniref:LuxR family transcriptional regulator n=1 Tax=Embleya hyalina TaxID=516124 RepID=A0A401YQM6_9ACTN|nr:LuxR C-terminal-related transcriptional regulator [Embleya hyalina]GCD96919.1 LuxR family transcriptional regulator [Embleya hyalina]